MPVYTFSEARYKLCLKCLSRCLTLGTTLTEDTLDTLLFSTIMRVAVGHSRSADSSSRQC